MNEIKETIRRVIHQHGRLSINVNRLEDDASLYDAGLTSLATVGVMLALESQLDVEFSESMLSRKTFQRIDAIAEAIAELRADAGLVPVGT
jgi:acyl carrier protein